MKTLPYYHVDVFSDRPFSGNGLTVFTESEGLSKEAMLRLTQEMRQFESIFLQRIEGTKVRAYIFTVGEELDFAGHPVLGAAATLHDLYYPEKQKAEWEFVLNKKTVQVTTEKGEGSFKATMNQGRAEFGKELGETETDWLMDAISLNKDDLYEGCRPVIVSTGLPYLIVPLRRNGLQAKIRVNDLEEKIRQLGAMFVGILDIPTLTIRTWDNLGSVEDIATGSLAGPSGAYLVKKGFQSSGTQIQLNQGVHLGRPSQLFVKTGMSSGELSDVYVSGHVYKISQSILLAAKYLF
ncbi:PhzF family phenazine biosynthesis protein [Mucilaginibacter ginsenosidivorans]|uniref:PhzF family phenazine biosynthesis protein n=1 Tax=Mucilaginibacter ginsenosidivorans TaxID=398053 RepID=A0A5B8UQG9_9SPHI|nr:PhzF family phenazine biosynthesis protein [Mucilaginibacter ginsenosidivorans]QEC61363.1 PhzF family phenazine biosynthesis protein [Mucilaginibacter ginsenosidivorans]